MDTLIKSGRLLTASETFISDILVKGEKISYIGENIDPKNLNVIDATNKIIMPGGIDPHTHFDLPMFDTISSDDHYSGHKAAAFGGTTTVLDFVPFDEITIGESISRWRVKADEKAAIDFSFHMNITKYNHDIAQEIAFLPDYGITSVKVFMAYNERLRLEDHQIFSVLTIAQEHGLLTMLHAENGDVIELLINEALRNGKTTPIWHARTRPAWSAVEATFRGAALAAQANAPIYVVHMNASGEVDQLEYARKKGVKIMGETCPQYLFFTEEHIKRSDGSKWICSPPMRSKQDNQRLWEGITEKVIQTIGTDHCPFFFDGTTSIEYEGKEILLPGKELGQNDFTKIPNGLPAVGDRLPILWSYGVKKNRITENEFIALLSTNPAKIFGLYPQKGSLMPGADADIVIWDPDKRVAYGRAYAQHRTDYNLYEGWDLEGYPDKVFLRGKLIVDNDQWLGNAGQGRFIYRKPGVTFL